MPRRWITQLDFSTGELDPRLEGRRDLERYGSSCRRARNCLIGKGGSMTRRPGFAHAITVNQGKMMLIGWPREDQDYLVVLSLTDGKLRLYDESESLLATLTASQTSGSIVNTDWAADSDEMILVHGSHAPRRLRHDGSSWILPDYPFTYYPYHKFAPTSMSLTPSGTTGSITLTTGSAFWAAGMVGSSVRYKGKRVTITGYTSTTEVDGTVVDTLADTTGSSDWDEQAWSDYRGWPRSACWHQSRLIIGGSQSLPDRIWMSKSANGRSFDLGDGDKDDDAIWARIQADEGVTIRFVRSQGPLIILCDGTEWIVPQQPITPTAFSFDRQASQGVARVKPGEIDAATIYLRSERDTASGDSDQPVIHLAWDELQQTFRPLDISLLNQHLIGMPVAIAVARGSQIDANNRVYLVNTSGSIAVLHLPSPERPGGTLLTSTLSFYSVAAVNGRLYVAAAIPTQHRIFRLDPAYALDAGYAFDKGAGVYSTTVGTFAALASRSDITVLGLTENDGWTVQTGTSNAPGVVTVATAVNKGEAGLNFTFQVQPMPLEPAAQTLGSLKSLVELRAHVLDSLDVRLGDDTNRELATAEDGSTIGDLTTDPITLFSGHVRVHGPGGWSEDVIPEARSTRPYSLTILSLNMLLET